MLLVALTGAVLTPVGRGVRDTFAVVAAREALVGLIAEARSAAISHGGATVRLDSAPWRAWAQAGGTPLRSVELARQLGVSVVLSRGRGAVELRYDALGLGQVASETIVLVRGDARRSLVISGYGRVRRP